MQENKLSDRARFLHTFLRDNGAKAIETAFVPRSNKKLKTTLEPGDSLWENYESIKCGMRFPRGTREQELMKLMMEIVRLEHGWAYHNGHCLHLSSKFRLGRVPRALQRA